MIRQIFLITLISACATAQKSELERDLELVAGFAGENDNQIESNPQIKSDSEGDSQEFDDEQDLQQSQEFNDEQGFQQDQEFDDEQGLQQNQEFNDEQGFQQDQEFNDEQGLQQDQEFNDEQGLQQEQQFEQLQDLNNQFGQIANNQGNAFGEPPLQQGQDFQQQSLDFENSFNEQLSDDKQLNNYNQQAVPLADSVLEQATEQPDPIATILEEFKGIPEPNEFSGAELPGTMKSLAAGEAPETYIIRPGDTLYDICDQLLDEATYWPKLWAMNSDIKNPHFIYPQFALQFYPGDNETPPVIKVVNIEEFEPEGDIKPNAAIETKKLFKPKENDFELLDPEDVVIPEKIDELFEEDVGRAVAMESMKVELPGLILPNKLDKLGKIARSDSSMQEGEVVLLKGNGFSVDTLYTVMRHQGRVWGVGHRYQFIANARVLSNDSGNHARAVLSNLNGAPQKGDIIVDYLSRQRRVDTSPSGSAELAAKISALTLAGQSLGMAGDFAFIKIQGEDVSTQQTIQIYRNAMRSYHKKSKVLDAHPIGIMQVIDVQNDIAIAYITHSDQEIMVGDKTSP